MFRSAWIIIISLAIIKFLTGFAAEIESVQLVGGTENFINIHSKGPYSLECSFRSGYDDPVQKVVWYKDNKQVYTWRSGSTVSSASSDLAGRVATSGRQNLQNIQFFRPSLQIGGSYICEVISRNTTVRSEPYILSVLDVASDDYSTSVSLIETVLLEPNSTEASADKNCTLLWQFHTPAIFPRPNVTCGYYSYLYDDITYALPAGLTMHRLQNGSWLAGFDHTLVDIADMPRETRLGCSVRIPQTSYKRVVKFEDNFEIDHLIDSEGCPAIFLDPLQRLQVTLEGSIINCRGDLVPVSNNEPIKATFRCSTSDFAAFSDGSVLENWSLELQCNPTDMTWRSSNSINMDASSNFTDMPTCVPRTASGGSGQTPLSIFVAFILICEVFIGILVSF